MGLIADAVREAIGHDKFNSELEERIEVAIKSAIAKLGRELLEETKQVRGRNMVGDGEIAGHYLDGKEAGVQELMARIAKM
jgi:hypothetical protein